MWEPSPRLIRKIWHQLAGFQHLRTVLVVTTVVGLSVKPAQGAQPQRSVLPTQASEKAKGHRAGLRKHVLLLSRCWRRAMFRVHQCVFFAHVFADLSAALTCGKAFSATCTCEGYSSQELWRIEGTQILWEYKGVKTATCCKENHVMLESLQKFRLWGTYSFNSKIEPARRRNAHFHSWVTRLPIEMNVHVANIFPQTVYC